MSQNFSFGFSVAGYGRVPGFSALAGHARKAGGRGWVGNVDQVVAGRALDLTSGMLNGALQVLLAVRAFKFEIARRHESRRLRELAKSCSEKPVPGITQARDNKALIVQAFIDRRRENGQ